MLENSFRIHFAVNIKMDYKGKRRIGINRDKGP